MKRIWRRCDICGRREKLIDIIKEYLLLNTDTTGYVTISDITFCGHDCYIKYINSLSKEDLLAFAEKNRNN